MPCIPKHPQLPGRRPARLYAAVLLTLVLAACSSGVVRAPEIGLQQPQFDDPGEQAGSLTVELSDEARKEAADNLKFRQVELDQTIRQALELNNLLAEQFDGGLPTIEVTVTSVRVRSSFSAIMFGFMAGDDHIEGDVTVRAADGNTLQEFSVSASYAFGGLVGGLDSSRLSWLYESFAEHVTEELTGQSGEQLESSQATPKVEPASTNITYNASPQRSLNGLWAGIGHRESGSCKMSSIGIGKVDLIHVELIVREPEISGHVTKAHHNYKSLVQVDASGRGIVSENGEFNLQFGVSELGAEIVLQGRLSKDGNQASGKWSTLNCQGTLSLTRKSPY